jgi:hypothetical protein
METSCLNSQQLVNMVQQGEGGDYLDGSYRFETLCSGISLHGGSLTARKTFQSTRLSEPYIAFVLLLEGSLDFGINREHYRIEAEGGHVLLIACDEEILFSRYLYEGRHTAKLTLKGLDRWLARPQYAGLLQAVYREKVRHWPLDSGLRRLALSSLKGAEHGGLADDLQREADVLQLLAGLWTDFLNRYPYTETAAEPPHPSESFIRLLNQAFDAGAHQVSALADALHISERTLQRRLKESFGTTASEWLRHKHMQYALYALGTDSVSIGEIAYHCGYAHVSSFTKAFREYFGCTPAELRKRGE